MRLVRTYIYVTSSPGQRKRQNKRCPSTEQMEHNKERIRFYNNSKKEKSITYISQSQVMQFHWLLLVTMASQDRQGGCWWWRGGLMGVKVPVDVTYIYIYIYIYTVRLIVISSLITYAYIILQYHYQYLYYYY